MNEFDTLTTRVWSWRSFARMREPQILTQVVWVELCKAASICLWTAYQCAQTLFISLIWMQEAVWGCCHPQQLNNDIMQSYVLHKHKWPRTPKSEPSRSRVGITVWGYCSMLYQVVYLVLYCWFLGGKGTPGMFDPVLWCLISQQGQGLTCWECLIEALHTYL